MRISSLFALVWIALIGLVGATPTNAQNQDLVGSYELLWRDLQGGNRMQAPDGVAGMLTYTRTRRNFNITWKREDGSTASIAYVGGYKLTEHQYCETPIYWMQNNIDGLGVVKYGAPAEKRVCSTVVRDGETILFSIKGEPVVAMFEGDSITATSTNEEGDVVFVDHWRRVD